MTKKEKLFYDLAYSTLNLIVVILALIAIHFLEMSHLLLHFKRIGYWILKFLIAYNILSAARKTLIAPILCLAIGMFSLFTSSYDGINLMTSVETWQLIMVSMLGFALTLLSHK